MFGYMFFCFLIQWIVVYIICPRRTSLHLVDLLWYSCRQIYPISHGSYGQNQKRRRKSGCSQKTLSDFCLLEDKDALKRTPRTPLERRKLSAVKISRQKKLENRLEYQIGWEPSTVPSGDWVVETTTSSSRVGRLVNGR